MIKQDIKIGLNRLLKFKAYSIINIGGLAVAVASVLVIFSFVFYHLSFDRNISDGENSYRIITRYGDGTYSANTFSAIGEYLSDCPEVASYSVSFPHLRLDEVFVNDKKIEANSAFFVNKSFLDYFSIKTIEGDENSINEPSTVLLTPDFAQKLFANQSPIGKTVFLRSFTANQDSHIPYTVTGIVEPLPKASHIQFEMLLSQKGHFAHQVEMLKTRKVRAGRIYVKLYPSADVKKLEEKLTLIAAPSLREVHGPPLEAFNHKLQNVRDIHFTTGMSNELETSISRSSVNILILIGLLIFILAAINFVIMNIARQSFYQKTSFVLNLFGGKKINLLNQVIVEILISICFSFVIAFLLVALSEHYFASFIFLENNISVQHTSFWLLLLVLFVLTNVLIIVLTSTNIFRYQPRLHQKAPNRKINTAKILVVFQFVIVIILIGFAITINRQMNFISTKDLGYTSENVIVIRVPQANEKVNVLKDELAKLPEVLSAGTTHHYPGFRLQDMNFTVGEIDFPFKFGFMSYDAIKTLGIKPLKFFTDEKEQATGVWMINETFYNNLRKHYTDEQIALSEFPEEESEEPVDPNERFIINGVMKDFHYASLYSKIENFAIHISKPGGIRFRFVLTRFKQNTFNSLLPLIKEKLEEIYPGQPINYRILDEELHAQYKSEQNLLELINIFSIISIIIACFGLTGLTIFVTENRTKEIGIRKVNGASIIEIIKLLNFDFIKWIILAFIIATPISYYVFSNWIQKFAYQIPLSWWIFTLAGLIAVVLALFTVSWFTYKSAKKNPVNALKYE